MKVAAYLQQHTLPQSPHFLRFKHRRTGECFCCLVFSPLSSSVCFLLVTSLMLVWHHSRCFIKLLVLLLGFVPSKIFFFVMPYITVLQQKVMHYSNCITFVMRYSQHCILTYNIQIYVKKENYRVRSCLCGCAGRTPSGFHFWIKLCVLL